MSSETEKNRIENVLKELEQTVAKGKHEVSPFLREHWEQSVKNILEKARQRIEEETEFMNK